MLGPSYLSVFKCWGTIKVYFSIKTMSMPRRFTMMFCIAMAGLESEVIKLGSCWHRPLKVMLIFSFFWTVIQNVSIIRHAIISSMREEGASFIAWRCSKTMRGFCEAVTEFFFFFSRCLTQITLSRHSDGHLQNYALWDGLLLAHSDPLILVFNCARSAVSSSPSLVVVLNKCRRFPQSDK